MAIMVGQAAARESNAMDRLCGFPPQISEKQIQSLPNLPELIPGLNIEKVTARLGGQPQKDIFIK